jgi:hypothetical protein
VLVLVVRMPTTLQLLKPSIVTLMVLQSSVLQVWSPLPLLLPLVDVTQSLVSVLLTLMTLLIPRFGVRPVLPDTSSVRHLVCHKPLLVLPTLPVRIPSPPPFVLLALPVIPQTVLEDVLPPKLTVRPLVQLSTRSVPLIPRSVPPVTQVTDLMPMVSVNQLNPPVQFLLPL